MFKYNPDTCGTEWINLVRGNQTYLTSPQFPAFYRPNTFCKWFFVDPSYGDDGTSKVYVVTYIYIFTRTSDYVTIGMSDTISQNTTICRHDHWYAPAEVFVLHNTMWITFQSNNDTYVYPGFMMKVERTGERGKKTLFVKLFSIILSQRQQL